MTSVQRFGFVVVLVSFLGVPTAGEQTPPQRSDLRTLSASSPMGTAVVTIREARLQGDCLSACPTTGFLSSSYHASSA